MIFTAENEYSAVLDTCVLVPMSLCDLLLRLAEEPALYRPLWSEEILQELGGVLKKRFHRTQEEVDWRLERMRDAFPEAMVTVPKELLKAIDCIPDENDKHVLAAAIMAHANAIITQNTKHFPPECLAKFGVLCQPTDEFLVHQYHLCPQVVLDKLDDQGAGIAQNRAYVIASLRAAAPGFCKLLEPLTM
jgi:predicted nucleic acid-binding protein